jgi:hypothetical protein
MEVHAGHGSKHAPPASTAIASEFGYWTFWFIFYIA